jgi:hypothetical protein
VVELKLRDDVRGELGDVAAHLEEDGLGFMDQRSASGLPIG